MVVLITNNFQHGEFRDVIREKGPTETPLKHPFGNGSHCYHKANIEWKRKEQCLLRKWRFGSINDIPVNPLEDYWHQEIKAWKNDFLTTILLE